MTKQYTENDIDRIAAELLKGNTIAFPTDTVYGIGVIYNSLEALKKLKKAKQRPETKPIPTMVSSINQINNLAILNDSALKIAHAFMPGPITLVLPKKDKIKDFVTNGKNTIAIRIPDNDFILKLIKKCNSPLLVSSANISGGSNCFNDKDVLKQLQGRIDGVVLGEAGGNMASTIVDMTGSNPIILRKGPISYKQIMDVIENR